MNTEIALYTTSASYGYHDMSMSIIIDSCQKCPYKSNAQTVPATCTYPKGTEQDYKDNKAQIQYTCPAILDKCKHLFK